ncbi:alcohol dehydrogenase [Penicillium antarcticum]|uniref:alcohol dehydrogenase n=1 Tax=Penicillium antarcticum TaxID=416450 RepID=UPI002390287D|nr:alcohol dehydrogenase [Penicillium antarcticum]KAJ5305921.1 alcohol dehydrogenase [Penicillium antarcticum]
MSLDATLAATMRVVALFAICGSDLHFYHGYTSAANVTWNLGHEAVGYVLRSEYPVFRMPTMSLIPIPFNNQTGNAT